jgi:hypothetical protein
VKQGTILVLGCYRGGTSRVAKMLHDAGVSMGLDYDPADATGYSNYEDYDLAAALHEGRSDDVIAIIAARNANAVWGFKWPGTVFHLDALLPLLRNPLLLFVWRDPVSCLESDRRWGGSYSWANILEHHRALIDAAIKHEDAYHMRFNDPLPELNGCNVT